MSCIPVFCQVNNQPQAEWPPSARDSNNNPGSNGQPTPAVPDVPEMPQQESCGCLHLSFEHHRGSLKVRVWQVADLLLPPPQISMIKDIFVRGYLIPDPGRKTNRRTESILVDGSKDKRVTNKAPPGGIQHIFTPSSFKFETPLQYTGMTPSIVAERSLRLEVCMTQFKSGRAFLMAMVHLPLAVAVRRPIRERYPLIPCMNVTIPNTMRVYNAQDIMIQNSSGSVSLSRSNSNMSQANSIQDNSERDHVENNDVDIDVDSLIKNFVASTDDDDDDESSTDSDDDEKDDGIGSSFEIRTVSTGPSSMTSSMASSMMSSTHTNIEMPIDEAGDNDLSEVIAHKTKQDPQSTVDISSLSPMQSKKKRIIPNELKIEMHDNIVSEESCQTENTSPIEPEHDEKPAIVIVDEELTHTVVDMAHLPGNVVIDVDEVVPSEKISKTVVENSSEKKKIIPIHIDLKDDDPISVDCVKDVVLDENSVEKSSDNVFISKDIGVEVIPQTSERKPQRRRIKVIPQDDDEISSEIRENVLSVSSLKDQEQSPMPISRPETPIWDYGDEFTGEEEAESIHKDSIEIPVSENTQQANEKEPDVTPQGPLAQSIARLGRTMTTLDTCLVQPAAVAPDKVRQLEDFDMEEEDDS